MTQRPETPDAGAAIRIGDKALDPNATRWGLLLVIFMRVVAALWILQGLVQWQIVLTAPSDLFSRAPAATGVAIVYFAVMDLLAAVGLWLATPWGGILWLMVALSQIVVAFALPDFFGGGRLVVLLDALLIALYLFLTYEAGREPERRGASRRAATRLWNRSWRFWGKLRS